MVDLSTDFVRYKLGYKKKDNNLSITGIFYNTVKQNIGKAFYTAGQKIVESKLSRIKILKLVAKYTGPSVSVVNNYKGLYDIYKNEVLKKSQKKKNV